LIEIDEVGRLPKESRILARPLKPELKLPIGGGKEGLLAALSDEWKRNKVDWRKMCVRSSDILRSISGVFSSGISTGEKPSGLGFPSRAQRARRRMESLSPRLMLSSLLEVDRAGRETPMTSAESRRVERDEQRR
jgi:hypothetical protein